LPTGEDITVNETELIKLLKDHAGINCITTKHMRQKTINVYKFDELSDEAKERALSIYSMECTYAWGNEAMDSLKAFISHFNCELKDWEVDFLLRDLLMAGIAEWETVVRRDAEYQYSEEGYKDLCEANEYEFTEDGELA
jgi:hypothetical protein